MGMGVGCPSVGSPVAQHPPGPRQTPPSQELLFPRQPPRHEAILSWRRREEGVTAPSAPSPAAGINKSRAGGALG